MTEWQPIETAPKDGSEVILAEISGAAHVGKSYGEIDIGAWGEFHEEDFWGNPITFWGWTSNYGRIEDPTHWMPLPEPPND